MRKQPKRSVKMSEKAEKEKKLMKNTRFGLVAALAG
jgi:hypothetical protein